MASLITSYSLAGLVNRLTWNTCLVQCITLYLYASVSTCFTCLWGLYLDVIINMIYRGSLGVGFHCLSVFAWAFWGIWLQPLPLTLIVFPSDLEAKHNLHVCVFCSLIPSSIFAPWGHYFEPPSGLGRHLSQTANIRTWCPRPDTILPPRCSTCAQIKIPWWVILTSASSKTIQWYQDLSTTNSDWTY